MTTTDFYKLAIAAAYIACGLYYTASRMNRTGFTPFWPLVWAFWIIPAIQETAKHIRG